MGLRALSSWTWVASNENHPGGEKPRAPAIRRTGSSEPAIGRRVLIVEDNWLVAIETEAALSDAGYEVVGIAVSAEEAVQLCETAGPSFVLMDIRLEGRRDGVEAAIEVRARYGIPSIFFTAHGDPETRARAEPAKPLGWILKPKAGPDLVRQLASLQGGEDPERHGS